MIKNKPQTVNIILFNLFSKLKLKIKYEIPIKVNIKEFIILFVVSEKLRNQFKIFADKIINAKNGIIFKKIFFIEV